MNGEPVKVVVPLSTIIGLLQHDENQHCPASFDLPLKHWASMEETWNSEERSDLHALVSRLAALNFIGRRVICLSLLIGLQLDLVGLEWETRIMVPEGMSPQSSSKFTPAEAKEYKYSIQHARRISHQDQRKVQVSAKLLLDLVADFSYKYCLMYRKYVTMFLLQIAMCRHLIMQLT